MVSAMQWLSKYRLLFILILGLLMSVLLLNEHLIPAGDNATYIVLGQSLVTGQGYRMISDPRSPAMGLYPPGYPLLLAAVLAITGKAHNLLAAILPLKLPSVLLFLGAIALVYDLLRRRNDLLASITILLTALHPDLLYFAVEIGTEIPYLFLSLCCLYLFEHYWRKSNFANIFVIAVFVALVSYIRSIALVLAVAFALYLFVWRRGRHAWLLLLIVGALVAPWFIYGSSLPTTGTSVGLGRSYFALYFSSDPYGTARASLSDWIARLGQNVYSYGLDIWPRLLFPHVFPVSTWLGHLGTLFVALFTVLMLGGFLLEARHGHVLEWYVALFFLSCICYLWPVARLVVPIVPFAIYYFLVAVGCISQWVKSLWRVPRSFLAHWERWALGAVSLVLVLSALVGDVRSIRRNLLYGWGQPVAVYYSRDAEWSNYLRAMDWIAQNTGPPSIVMCRKADLLYILIGHRALEYPYSSEASDLKRSVLENRVVYIIEDAFRWTLTTRDYLRPALNAWLAAEPEALSLVYETGTPHTRVWRVDHQY